MYPSPQKEEKNTHPYLRAKMTIGSCKGPVDYNMGQAVFHHDDIPDSRRKRADEVKDWKSSKILSINRGNWNKSMDPNIPICERRRMENHVRDRSKPYQYNYRSEYLNFAKATDPLDLPTKFHISAQLEVDAEKIRQKMIEDRVSRGQFTRTGEMPVHPNLLDKDPWDFGMVLTPEVRQQCLDIKTDKARAWTAKSNDRILKQSASYVGPMARVKQLTKTIRAQKKAGTWSIPTETKQMELHEQEPIDKSTFINRQAVEKSTRYKVEEHTGVYEFNKMEGKYMWSDTGSYDFASRGDTIKCYNPDRYNLEGPTTFRPIDQKLLNTAHFCKV
jgi:hypothetical protein